MIVLFFFSKLDFINISLPFIVVSTAEIYETELCGTIPYFKRLSQLVKRGHRGKCLRSANGSICVACMYFSFDLLTQLDARRFGPHHLNALPFCIRLADLEFVEELWTGALSKVLRLASVVRPSPHFLTPRAFEVTVSNVFHDILMVVVMVVDIVVI